MLPPITIPELDPATAIDFNNDQVLLRQGLNDRRATLDQINTFRLENYPTLTSQLVASDVILIGRNNGGGSYINYTADPRRLGFLVGVSMYFYCDTNQAPLYWQNIPSLGNRVLAVKANSAASGGAGGGANSAYTNWGLQGSWNLPDHQLTIAEMPNHRHEVNGTGATSGTGNLTRGYRETNSQPSRPWNTRSTGGDGAHNHGNSFRPLAAVGLICIKNG